MGALWQCNSLKHASTALMRGYTLIELVVVIAILGVIGVGLFSIYTTSIRSYIEASQRAELTTSARLGIERLSRELRNALPNSVRVTSDGNCVEFRPVIAGTSYIDLPTTSASNTLTMAPVTLPAGSWSASVMPLMSSDGSQSDMYGPSPLTTAGIVSISAPDGNNIVTVTLDRSLQFPRSSPTRRLFIVGGAVSFCVTPGSDLRRYSSYTSTVSQPNLAGVSGGNLLAQNVSNGDASNPVFRYAPGTLERNAVLGMQLRMTAGNESLRYAHELVIRNVP